MIERTPILDAVTHIILILGLAFVLVPFWIVICASTQSIAEVNQVPLSLWFGHSGWENFAEAWTRGGLGVKLANSLIMATSVAIGKVVLAGLSAFAIVFFRWPLRMAAFWLIFITLMLPLEVRIVPTYAIAANALLPFQALLDVTGLSFVIQSLTGVKVALEWNLLNSYPGLVLPLIATATGTFLYRQFFLTIPDELVEATKMDGAGPVRFLFQILMPLSRTNMLALGAIMFVYTWNQYLWPLLITTDPDHFGTAVVELKKLVPAQFGLPDWNITMAAAVMIMAPPMVIIAFMQRWFVRGLIATEK